ncbi:MAG TPA: MEDS domain-containing protein [Candidatus Angelobacter sp.]|jgi:PAS domain-containing protein
MKGIENSLQMPSRQSVKPDEAPLPSTLACGHAVQFYESDSALIETLGAHVGTALSSGDTVIVVATKPHRTALADELRLRKIDAASAIKSGRFICLDAAEILAKFMVGGGPDKKRFADTIGALVSGAEARTRQGHRLVVYGEMVALLWAEGKRDATVRLEELWNELAQKHNFNLLCGYPVSAFTRLEHRQLFFNICGEHTHVNPAESYPAAGSEKQRRRSVARLQVKAKVLESEIRLSQERISILQKVTKAGTWELDIVNDTFSFSSAAAKLLGFPSSNRVRLGQLMDLMYYSGDREMVFQHLQAGQRHRKEFSTTFRVRQGNETRVIAIQGKTFYNGGAPIMLGVLSDVTPATEISPARQHNSAKKIAHVAH